MEGLDIFPHSRLEMCLMAPTYQTIMMAKLYSFKRSNIIKDFLGLEMESELVGSKHIMIGKSILYQPVNTLLDAKQERDSVYPDAVDSPKRNGSLIPWEGKIGVKGKTYKVESTTVFFD